jgi:hypothetical protein
VPPAQKQVLHDLGPDSAGNDVQQLFVLDTQTGKRRQLTHQSVADPTAFCCASFLNSRTVLFDVV